MIIGYYNEEGIFYTCFDSRNPKEQANDITEAVLIDSQIVMRSAVEMVIDGKQELRPREKPMKFIEARTFIKYLTQFYGEDSRSI